MSVVFRNKLGAFLSHVPLDKNVTYEESQEDGKMRRDGEPYDKSVHIKELYELKRELFAVYAPFMMESQADRIKREVTIAASSGYIKETSAQRKRRKKARIEPVLSEAENKIFETIIKAMPSLIEEARKLQYIDEPKPQPDLPINNNQAAQAASNIVGCGQMFQTFCCHDDDNEMTGQDEHDFLEAFFLNDMSSCRAESIIDRCVHNLEEQTIILLINGHKFVIPPVSSFLTSSFHHFVSGGYKQLKVKSGYDLIVIDPPWNNKSVKRKKSYHMVQEEDLKQIPMSDLASRRGLVCVWITNNKKLKNFVINELFPHWSLDFFAEWYWLKVTRHGEPVCDMLSSHKKPYEQLLVGCNKIQPVKSPEPSMCNLESPSDSPLTGKQSVDKMIFSVDNNSSSSENIDRGVLSVPKDYVLVSVPCSLHSKKPSLAEIMSEYLPSQPSCLELFARNLTPQWVSWGNEARQELLPTHPTIQNTLYGSPNSATKDIQILQTGFSCPRNSQLWLEEEDFYNPY